MLPLLLPFYSLDYLGCWQLLDQPFIFYIFPSFHRSLPRFPYGVYNYFAVSCACSPLFRPPRSYPRSFPFPLSSSPFPSPLLSSLPSPFLSCFFVHLHSRSRSPSRSVPVPMTVHVPIPTSVPVTVSVPTPTPIPPPPLFAPSCLLDPVTSSVRCACTDTGPCERSCGVVASATPCLQRW